MSFSTHARCDWCEEVLIADDEDELVDAGWLVLRFAEESMDFCQLDCVAKWCGSDSAVEMVSNTDEDENES